MWVGGASLNKTVKLTWIHEEVVRNQAYKYTHCTKSPWALLCVLSLDVVQIFSPFSWLFYSQVLNHRQIFRLHSPYAPTRSTRIARCCSQKVKLQTCQFWIPEINISLPTSVCTAPLTYSDFPPDKGKYRQIFGTHPSYTPIWVIKSVYYRFQRVRIKTWKGIALILNIS